LAFKALFSYMVCSYKKRVLQDISEMRWELKRVWYM